MAAPLNWMADIAIESDVPTHSRVQVIIRNNVCTVSRGENVLERKAGVVANEPIGPRERLIRFDDGTVWAAKMPVRKSEGCGCS